jgi:hypothetical protein
MHEHRNQQKNAKSEAAFEIYVDFVKIHLSIFVEFNHRVNLLVVSEDNITAFSICYLKIQQS